MYSVAGGGRQDTFSSLTVCTQGLLTDIPQSPVGLQEVSLEQYTALVSSHKQSIMLSLPTPNTFSNRFFYRLLPAKILIPNFESNNEERKDERKDSQERKAKVEFCTY